MRVHSKHAHLPCCQAGVQRAMEACSCYIHTRHKNASMFIGRTEGSSPCNMVEREKRGQQERERKARNCSMEVVVGRKLE